MSEKFNAAAGTDDPRRPLCGRAEDLVAYLYGEAGEREAKGFEQHLGGCQACREELSAFGVVREAVGAWRREALSVAPSVALGEALADGAVSAGGRRLSAPARKRSAAAALREFFALSPMWLRAGALAATLAVCALAGLTLARTEIRWDENGVAFRAGAEAGERVVMRTVEVTAPDTFTRAQVDEMIKGEVTRARAEAQAEAVASNSSVPPVIVRAGDRSAGPAPNVKPRRAAGPKNGAPGRSRDQLAGPVEEDLTTLYDLLRAVN